MTALAPMGGYEKRVMRQRQQQVLDLVAIIGQILSEFGERRPHRQAPRPPGGSTQRTDHPGPDAPSPGKNLGKDREAWRKWWAEEQGYTYEPPAPRSRQDLTLPESKPTYAR